MFKYLKNLSAEEIPGVRVFLNLISNVLRYSMIIWIISFVGLHWSVFVLSIVAIMSLCGITLYEDWLMGKDKKEKWMIYFLSFVNTVCFWGLIYYFVSHYNNINHTTSVLLITSFVLHIFRVVAGITLLPKNIKMLQDFKKMNTDYKEGNTENWRVMNEFESETKKFAKHVLKSFIFVFFPAITSMVLLLISFFKIISTMDVPLILKLFIVFVIIFETIMSNLSQKLKKELISKNF